MNLMRTILVHLHVSLPRSDSREPQEIADVVETSISATTALSVKVALAEEIREDDQPEKFYTVHPFDDEWVWDPKKSGSYPWVTASLQEAIDHANLVRLEYASLEGQDPEWIAGFWSSIYADDASPDAEASGTMIGWVDPFGNYVEGAKPPLDENGAWKEEGA